MLDQATAALPGAVIKQKGIGRRLVEYSGKRLVLVQRGPAVEALGYDLTDERLVTHGRWTEGVGWQWTQRRYGRSEYRLIKTALPR